jgi:hypothetical protein
LQDLWNTPRGLASCDKILYGTEENESLTNNDNDNANNMDGNNNEEEDGRNSTRLEIA